MTETSTSADSSSSADSADTSTESAPVQADSYDEGDSDYDSLPDYGEVDDLDEGDTDYDSLPDYGADSGLEDPELSYDDLPDPAADTASEPQLWEPDETIQVQGEGTSAPGDSPGHEDPAVEAAGSDVEQALEQGERQDEARQAVDAAYDKAEAEGLPPNTKEQFEADAQRAIDEAPTETGAKQVEFKEPGPAKEAEAQDPGPAKEVEFQDPTGGSVDTPTDSPPETAAAVEPNVADSPVDSDDDPTADQSDEGRQVDIDAARAEVQQVHQEKEARAAVAEAVGDQDETESVAATPDAVGDGAGDDAVLANDVVEERVAEPSEVSEESSDSGAERVTELTPAELSALQDYTAMAYEPLNSALWRGSVDDVAKVADLSHDLSSALEKLPAHEGQVIRGSEPGRPIEAYDLSRYEPGERIVENGYISTTTNPDGLLPDFDGPVAWVIESKSGRDVSSVSSVSGESEVLFDRFTSFTVLSKEFDPTSGPDGTWIIYMEEEPRR